jgi:hypothetical protein
MHTRSFFPAHFALAAATPSRAQGFVSPFIGYDFGGRSGRCIPIYSVDWG